MTGFGPFHNITVNPSWEVVKALVKERPTIEVDGRIYAIKIPATPVPVAYGAVDQCASTGNHYGVGEDDESPCLVIHCGVGQFPSGLVLESIAWNEGYGMPDCDGKRHESGTCISGAPPILKTSLDLECVRDTVAGSCTTDVIVSTDAGRYLCEYIFYKSLHAVQKQCAAGLCPLVAGPAALFVHVPPRIGEPCSMDALVDALSAVVKCCLQQLQDRSIQVVELADMLGAEPQCAAMLLRECDFNLEAAARTFFDSQEREQPLLVHH